MQSFKIRFPTNVTVASKTMKNQMDVVVPSVIFCCIFSATFSAPRCLFGHFFYANMSPWFHYLHLFLLSQYEHEKRVTERNKKMDDQITANNDIIVKKELQIAALFDAQQSATKLSYKLICISY